MVAELPAPNGSISYQLRIDDPHVVVFENDFVLRFLLDSDGIRADGHLHVNVGPTTLKAAAAFTR